MNVHKNARLTIEGRKLLIERIRVMGLAAAAEAAGVSLRTARKWLARFEEHGLEGLADRSSRPRRTRSTVDKALERSIGNCAGFACRCGASQSSSAAVFRPSLAWLLDWACQA